MLRRRLFNSCHPEAERFCEVEGPAFSAHIRIATAVLLLCATAFSQGPPRTLQERLGYPATARLLIIHADDFGMAHSVNRATEEALEQGWITSASIMVPCPWFPEVVQWARAHPHADLGIHLVLNSEWDDFRWGPVAPSDHVKSLLEPSGYFTLDPVYLKNADPVDVKLEIRAQIERARKAGIPISHLDSHMLALVSTPELFRVYDGIRQQYKLPILLEKQGPVAVPAGATATQGTVILDKVIAMDPGISDKDWLNWYEKTLGALSPGVYQLVVHLAYDDDEMRAATRGHADWGSAWRQRDLDLVRSPDFQKFLRDQGFTLVKWSDITARLSAAP